MGVVGKADARSLNQKSCLGSSRRRPATMLVALGGASRSHTGRSQLGAIRTMLKVALAYRGSSRKVVCNTAGPTIDSA
jgi:hypothetical protein